jgi:RNA polymerase primary sigma factor
VTKLRRDQMIESNLGLVHYVANRYRGLGVPFDDLVQEGTMGLMRAVDRFDDSRGLKFSTYAMWWIRRAIVNAVREASTIRIPPQAGRQLFAVREAESELRRLGAGSPSSEAIAERAGLSPRSVRALRGAARVTASLDQEVGEDGTPLVDLVADPDSSEPWSGVAQQETRRHVSWMLQLLPPRHRDVVVRRFGLSSGEEQSHAEIAVKLSISEERSRQLEREALHRLRELGGGRLPAAA